MIVNIVFKSGTTWSVELNQESLERLRSAMVLGNPIFSNEHLIINIPSVAAIEELE